MNRLRQIAVISSILVLIGTFLCVGCAKENPRSESLATESNAASHPSTQVLAISKSGVRATLRHLPTDTVMLGSEQVYRHQIASLANPAFDSKTYAIQLEKATRALDDRRRRHEQHVYFLLEIAHEDQTKDLIYERLEDGGVAHGRWFQKLLYSLDRHIYLSSQGDSIPLSLYHMENSFGLTKGRRFTLAFPAVWKDRPILARQKEGLRLTIEDFGLGLFSFDLATLAVRKSTKAGIGLNDD